MESDKSAKERSPNDQRSDVKNPNNPEQKAATDNRANQLNPNNPKNPENAEKAPANEVYKGNWTPTGFYVESCACFTRVEWRSKQSVNLIAHCCY